MAVRLDSVLRATIKKSVASYNQKLKYYDNKGIKNLPSKVSYKQIINLGSRKLIQNKINSLKKLNIKSVENIVVNDTLVSRYEYDSIRKRIINDRRTLKNRIKNLAKVEYKYYGKKTGLTMGEEASMMDLMGNLKQGKLRNDKLISNLRKYEILSSISPSKYLKMTEAEKERFNKLLNTIESPYINPKFKQSYLEMLATLGYNYDIDPEKMSKIMKKLENLSDEEFDKLFTEDLAFKRAINYYIVNQINLGVIDNKDEVKNLFDNMYENIDQMVSK